jgi:hypothetical protein
MQLSEKDIEEFKRIYIKEFGEGASDQEIFEAAQRLAHVYSLLSLPLPSERKNLPPERDTSS